MNTGGTDPRLDEAAFDFFFRFSRFEFCLKQHSYLKSTDPGKKAEPNWDKFVKKHRVAYTATPNALALIRAKPRQQVVAANAGLGWKELQFEPNEYDLQKTTLLLRLVRNNLFHGGKQGDHHWDNAQKTVQLLKTSCAVLDELAELARFGDDYRRAYRSASAGVD
jgi:hypothetical protein